MNKAPKKYLALCAAGLMIFTSAAALAEESTDTPVATTATTQQTTTKSRKTSTALTEEQTQAKAAAQSAYYAAEEAVLAEMAAAGALDKDAVDQYLAQRDASVQVAAWDYSSWTLDQISALKQAVALGSTSDILFAGLVSQGALSEADAELFKLAYAKTTNIYASLDTSKATQGMITKLNDAKTAYQQALTDAGITTVQTVQVKFHGGKRR